MASLDDGGFRAFSFSAAVCVVSCLKTRGVIPVRMEFSLTIGPVLGFGIMRPGVTFTGTGREQSRESLGRNLAEDGWRFSTSTSPAQVDVEASICSIIGPKG